MKKISLILILCGAVALAGIYGCTSSTSSGGVTLGPDGRLYVLNQGANTMYVYNTATLELVDSIETVVNKPHYIEFSPDGAYFYIVTLETTGKVGKYDAQTLELVDSVTAPPHVQPTAISITPDSKYGYICNFSSAIDPTFIHKYDLTTLTRIDSMQAGITTHDVKITSDGSTVVACNRFSDNVTLVHTDGDTVSFVNIDPDNVYPPGTAAYGPFGIAIDHRDSLAFVACMDAQQIRVVDIDAQTVVDSIDVPVTPGGLIYGPTLMAVHPNNTVVFVTTRGGNSVVAVDFATRQVVADIPLSTRFPFGITMSDDGSRVYAACVGEPFGTGMVYVIDGDSYTKVDSITVGAESFGLIWRPL